MSSLRSSHSVHSLSHHPGSPERTRDSILRDQRNAELLAGCIRKLKASNEPDGSSLYDSLTLAFGSNLRTVYSRDNCPTLVTGGGAGFQHGRHTVMEMKTPLCNLWLSMLRGSGVRADSFGDATGGIDELYKA